MDRAGLQAWVALYGRAWRTPATELLAELFAPEATYQTAPFEEPFQGLPAIAAMWEAEREGPEEVFAIDSEVVGGEGGTGGARLGGSGATREAGPCPQRGGLCGRGAPGVAGSKAREPARRPPRSGIGHAM